MSWEKVKLGDIAEFSNGVNFDKSAYAPGIKLISVSNFGNRFYPDYSELSEISADAVKKNDYLQHGDIVFVRSNGNKELVGRCMLIDNPPTHTTYSGFCIRARVKDTTRFNPKFLTYHFKHDGFRIAMAGNAVGANIQNLSQGRLSAYIAYIPPIETQHRIADTLSAYDDLIENNRKQIKLLEEAAQRLYKEWFVDLRFPGHEHTNIVDGVPGGWEKSTVSNISSVLRRGISPKYNDQAELMVINQKCIRQTVVTFDEARKQEKPFPEEMNLQDGDTVICSTGAGTLGRVGQIFGNYPQTTFDSHVTLVRAKPDFGTQYLFHFLKSHQEYLMGMGKGSTNQLELSRGTIQDLGILVPTKEIRKGFEMLAQSIHDKIGVANAEIRHLQNTRNRLLPKLMSGEVEI